MSNLEAIIYEAIKLSAGDDQAAIITPRVMKAIRALLDEKAQGVKQEVLNILKDHGLRKLAVFELERMAVDLVTLVEFMQAEGHLEMETQIVQLKVQLKASEGRVENLKRDTRKLARFRADCLLAESDSASAERALADSKVRVARLRLKVDELENQLKDLKKK